MVVIDETTGRQVSDDGVFLVAYINGSGQPRYKWVTNLPDWLSSAEYSQYAAGVVSADGCARAHVYKGMGYGLDGGASADAFLESALQTLHDEPRGREAAMFRHPCGTRSQEVSA